jgi:hypothetical protein
MAMKRIVRLVMVAAVMSAMTFSVKAQSTVTQNVGVSIVQAIELTAGQQLHFGTMSVPKADVKVTVDAAGSRTADIPANVDFLSGAPVAQNAVFTLTGSDNATYSIDLPASITLSDGGTNSITVDTFTAASDSDGAGLTGTIDATGNDGFSVGATLNLVSGQPEGVYSGTFDVTVSYN